MEIHGNLEIQIATNINWTYLFPIFHQNPYMPGMEGW